MYLVLSATYLWDLYRTGFTIALVIHSLDSLWGLGTRGFGVSTHLQDFYRPRYPLGRSHSTNVLFKQAPKISVSGEYFLIILLKARQ